MNGLTRIFVMTNAHYFGIMDDFLDFELDEDYGDMFITQPAPSDNCVSLEEDGENEFKTVKDPQYSDISEDEESARDSRLR